MSGISKNVELKKTIAQDGKLNRFYKLAIALCVLFIATKSPVDISSFIELIHTNQLFSVVNKRPDELGKSTFSFTTFFKTNHCANAEREILFVWVALMPVVGNPIIYLFCVTEYRSEAHFPLYISLELD